MSEEEVKKEMDAERSVEKCVPDFYVNSTNFVISAFDVQINFGVQSDSVESPENVAIIRMSLQHALVVSKLLLKRLRAVEKTVGKINLPQDLLRELEIEEDNPDGSDAEV